MPKKKRGKRQFEATSPDGSNPPVPVAPGTTEGPTQVKQRNQQRTSFDQQVALPGPSTQHLTQDTQKLAISNYRGGTAGRKIMVETNHTKMNFGNLKECYHYDVKIEPDKPKKYLRDVFRIFMLKNFPNRIAAFDGVKNMWSVAELIVPNKKLSDEIELEIPDSSKTILFKVRVVFTHIVDLRPLTDMSIKPYQEAMQVAEIVLRGSPSMLCIQAGRCFYSPPTPRVLLGDGKEIYHGFYQSVSRGWKQHFFNIDVAHKVFPTEMNIIDLIADLASNNKYKVTPADLLKCEKLQGFVHKKLSEHMKGLMVTYEIPGMRRSFKVNDLADPPRFNKFTNAENKSMTIEQYFLQEKKIKLKYPLLPTLWVGNPKRETRIYLPVELCTVKKDQKAYLDLNAFQRTQMIKITASSTEMRKEKIMKEMDRIKHNNDLCMKEFGFSINSQFEKIEARVLDAPILQYSNKIESTPNRGVWNQTAGFLEASTARSWVIISLSDYVKNSSDIENFTTLISKVSARRGMNLTRNPSAFEVLKKRNPIIGDVQRILEKYSDNDIIFVIIPKSAYFPAYSYVKRSAEINMKCLTQCIVDQTLTRMNESTASQILLKVNSKLNGTNHCLKEKPDILNVPCMIMGADVTHPSPTAKNIPSFAAVCASHDPTAFFRYNTCIRVQPPKVEVIEDLENITKIQLKYFYEMNQGQKPQKIIMFRDGVSDGQFEEIRMKELRAIQRACRSMESGYEPKITFIVVQKRHHTRFFPNRKDTYDTKNYNVPPGTCVDTVITNPENMDFYLVSHASIQGVAKPTKYSILWDDNDLTYDDLEQLTYYLCHMYTRCNRSVSYPAPTYYAHLAAARAKAYFDGERINLNDLPNEQKKLNNERIRDQNPMFFV